MKHFLRLLFLPVLLALISVPLGANLHNLTPITGTGATVQISTSTARVTYIQVIADSTNSAAMYFGDSTTASGTGLKIAAGGGYSTPTCDHCLYTLASHYVYLANGDKAYIAWGD